MLQLVRKEIVVKKTVPKAARFFLQQLILTIFSSHKSLILKSRWKREECYIPLCKWTLVT